MTSLLMKFRHQVGRRGAFLGFLTVLDFVYGYFLLYPPPNAPNANAAVNFPLLPVQVWAGWWLLTAFACAVGMFLKYDRVAFGLAALIKTAWGLRYAYLWYSGLQEAWAAMTIWLIFALIVVVIAGWPEELSLPPEIKDQVSDAN